ncbi:hypothetical protein [Lentilactobacillus kefiri]|uniref:hypothetical protein n=1 Tax=Lentilactobacillus kefiri TaxID=33962 RepID=UPI0024694670|nr:hypothetical protein [Lentilactobacillus kefiri]MDH5108482.1 hypothetical protein [Lentilactobacillus kefiri]
MQYMSKSELKELFIREDYHVTKAVVILLKQAGRYATRAENLQDKSQLEACENSRAKYICEAIEVADMEKKQHWRLLEDKMHYLHELNDKYGDVDFINDLEDLKKLLLIYRLEDMAVNQQKNEALELVE